MDIYHIPNDDGKSYRLNKFVEYQHEVPSIHYRVLGEYIKKYVPNKNQAVLMCWYMSCTYNEVTCCLLQELINPKAISKSNMIEYFNNFWSDWKDKLDFGSSRKYAKNMDWFPVLMQEFFEETKKHPYKWLLSFQKDNGEESYKALFTHIQSMRFVGRFAAELFMESVLYLNNFFGTNFVEPSKLDWKKCSNLTSGVLNIFYHDKEANLFDKTKKLPCPEEYLTKKLEQIQEKIHLTYPEQDNEINLFVGKVCSFRNLFKGTRYGGFHHDRELGVLNTYYKELPQFEFLWDCLFELRKDMFPHRFLGELNGWEGIRTERKKLWLTTGNTGVELDV